MCQSSGNTEMAQVPTTPFNVSASQKRPFEAKQPITNQIHRVAVVLTFQSQSRSRDEQTTKIYHTPPTAQETTTADKIL